MDTILHILGRQPCMMQKLTGLYCPGCGGTRAVRALLAGHPLQSFLYHPFVLYAVVLMGILIFFRLAEKVSWERSGVFPAGRCGSGLVSFSLSEIGF